LKFKHIILLFLIIFLVGFGFVLGNGNKEKPIEASASHILFESIPTLIDTKSFVLNYVNPLKNIDVDAKAAILINAETEEILYEKNIDESAPIASMSKLMSAYLILEAIEENVISWEDDVPISDYAYTISHREPFSSIKLEQEENYKVKELFDAMMISSANDATVALAEKIYGTEKAFVEEMNKRANQLGFANSHFVDTTGLGNMNLFDFFTIGTIDDVNEMSARELAELARILIEKFPHLLDITQTISYESGGETYHNTNWMLMGNNKESLEEFDLDLGFEGVEGLKTGYTNASGYGFTGTIVIEDVRYISVIMDTEAVGDRFIETKKLYEGIINQLY